MATDALTAGTGAPVARERSRSHPIVPGLAGLALTAIVLGLLWDSGGYFPTSYLRAGAAASIVLGAMIAGARPAHGTSRSAKVALGSLAGLTAWTGLSALWSASPDNAIAAMQRDLAHLAIFGLALVAVGSGRYARHMVWGAMLVIAVVVTGSLLSRLYPDLVASPGLAVTVNYRLGYPLSYWNALGCLAAMGAVLSFGLAADPRTAWPLRAACAGFTVMAVTTMYFSLSRGAWLALMVGLVVLAALSAHRGALLLTALIVGTGSALAVARASSYAALTDNPTLDHGQAAAGHAFGPQLWLLVALVALAQGVIAAGRASPVLMANVDRYAPRVALAVAGVVGVALMGGYVMKAAQAEGSVAHALDRSQAFVSRQWRDFMSPTVPSNQLGSSTARLTTAKGSRSETYRVALDGFKDAPLAGQGAGSYAVGWARHRKVDEGAVNAHSLELETLYELGLVGILLLAGFLGAAGVAAVRGRRRPGGLSRNQSAAVAGAAAVWVAHSAVDWDWQMSGLTAVALVLLATLFPYGRRSATPARAGDPGFSGRPGR